MNHDPSIREIFLTIRPKLFALAYQMTKSIADAEDVVQDVFLLQIRRFIIITKKVLPEPLSMQLT